MMKKILSILLIFIALLTACSNKSASETVNTKDLGKGKTMVLVFETNPTTGYDWESSYADGENYAVLHLDRENFETNEGVVGGPGKRTYYFMADKAGKQFITFTYRRPWEGGEVAYDVVYEVEVDNDLNITCLKKTKGSVESEEDISFFPDPTFE